MGGYEGGYKGVDMRGGGEGGQCGYEGRYKEVGKESG